MDYVILNYLVSFTIPLFGGESGGLINKISFVNLSWIFLGLKSFTDLINVRLIYWKFCELLFPWGIFLFSFFFFLPFFLNICNLQYISILERFSSKANKALKEKLTSRHYCPLHWVSSLLMLSFILLDFTKSTVCTKL